MANSVKFAITNDDKMDFLRLIILKEEDNKYSIKIATHDNPYEIYLYHLFNSQPDIINPIHNKDEITYHADRGDNPVKIHIKDNSGPNSIYTTLPISEILAPSSTDIFMIPLMKICLPNKSNKAYVNSRNNKEINVGDSNIIELYMHSSGLDYKDIEYFDLLYTFFSIEYFSTYDIEFSREKQKIFYEKMKEEGKKTPTRIYSTDIGISIRCVMYRDDKYQNDKMRIIFMDNKYSNDLILNTIFTYHLENNKCVNGVWNNVYIRPCKEKDIPPVAEFGRPFVKDSVIEHLIRRTNDINKKHYYYNFGLESISRMRKLLSFKK